MCGSYLCWKSPVDDFVSVIDLDHQAFNEESIFNEVCRVEYSKMYSRINLKGLIDTINHQDSDQMIALNQCSPLYALHNFSDGNFNEEYIKSRSKMLQLTIKGRALFYDLNCTHQSSSQNANVIEHYPIQEEPALNHLLHS